MADIQLPVLQNSPADTAFREAIAAELQIRFPRRPIRRVLLIQPPDCSTDIFDLATARGYRYSSFPPNGLLVIAEHLRNNGFEVEVLDLNFLLLAKVRSLNDGADFDHAEAWRTFLHQKLDEFEPDVAGVTCMFTMTHPVFKEVVRETKRYKNVPVVIGGVHVTNDTERILRDIGAADVAGTHEAEVGFLKFLQFLSNEAGVTAQDLRQLAMIIGDRYCEVNDKYLPLPDDINIIPAYDLVDTANYSRWGPIGSFGFLLPKGTRIATVLTNRGCRAQCTFCSVRSFNGPGVRSRSAQSVADEISLLYNDFGIRHFMALDDDLFYNERRTIAIFNEIVRRNLKITWDASNGVIAAAASAEILHAAAESGCIGLFFGLESGNPKMLREMRKPGTVDKFREAALRLKKYPQIFSRGFLMLGFPNETLRMMMDTLNLALELDMDWYNTTILQPLPSTPVYQFMMEQGLLDDATDVVRYEVGPYSKRTEREKQQRLVADSFAEAFAHIKMDEVPSKEQLSNIWFYVNYKVNFERVKATADPIKLSMRLKLLRDIGDRVSLDHAFAHLYAGILEEKSGNTEEAKRRLRCTETALAGSAYWRDKFAAFHVFPELSQLKERLLPGPLTVPERPERVNEAVEVNQHDWR